MLRPAALTLALSATLVPTTLHSQAPDTAAGRAAYARVVAFRDSMERAPRLAEAGYRVLAVDYRGLLDRVRETQR